MKKRDAGEVVKELTDACLFPFGSHKGKRMDQVPAHYLDWFDGQEWANQWPLVRKYIKKNRTVLNQELEDGRK